MMRGFLILLALVIARSAGADDGIGFSVPKERPRERKQKQKQQRSRQPSESALGSPRRLVVSVGVGLGLAWKTHSFVGAAADTVQYESGAYSQFRASLDLFPLQFLTRSTFGRLGLRFVFDRSAGLSTASPEGTDVATTIERYWGGLDFRVPRFSWRYAPLIELRLGVTHSAFTVSEGLEIEDLYLSSLAAGGSIRWPIRSYLQLRAGAEYRLLLGARSPALDSHIVSTGGAHGLELEAGLQGTVIFGLGYAVSFIYDHIGGIFEPAAADGSPLELQDRVVSVIAGLNYEV